MKDGQVSIKITKPRLTIDGFKVDEPEKKKPEKKSPINKPKPRKSKADLKDRTSISEAQSKGQQSSIINGVKGLDESIPQFSRGRSDGRPQKEEESLGGGIVEEDIDDQIHGEERAVDMDDDDDEEEEPDDHDQNADGGVEFDEDYQNYQGSPGAAGAM